MRRHKWRAGDVIQVTIPAGRRYLQFVGKDYKKVDVLRVLDLFTDEALPDISLVVQARTLYWIQSLCSALVEDHRFSFVGNSKGAGAIPMFRRRFFGGWILLDGESEAFLPSPISDETASISLDQGVPADWVVDALSSGWLPQDDRDDVRDEISVRKEKQERSTTPGNRETQMFIDFPTAEKAAGARAELERRGYTVERDRESQTLLVIQAWRSGEELSAMDLIEIELSLLCLPFDGAVRGRETTA